MKFKKDYINYLLSTVINESNGNLKNELWLKDLANKIISLDDMVKLTYLVGKTAGLESLFKYLLYISDKIDKSQISIFNLKDNFEYDSRNLKKIINGIVEYRSQKFEEKIFIADKIPEEEPAAMDLTEEFVEEENIITEETSASDVDKGMTLIENYEDSTEGEVFELENINETVEKSGASDKELPGTVTDDEFTEDEKEISEGKEEIFDVSDIENEVEKEPDEETEVQESETKQPEIEPLDEPEVEDEPKVEEEPEIEIIVKKPETSEILSTESQPKEESVTNEAYYTFETKFFEEVKILEKLFVTVDREGKKSKDGKLSKKSLQSLTEIIEITSELLNLSRQLMFDLIADVFLTMNLYFTKAISSPEIIDSEKIKLFDSALALVNSLIRGEDYLNYDIVVDKLEKLKAQLRGSEDQAAFSKPEKAKEPAENAKVPETEIPNAVEEQPEEEEITLTSEEMPEIIKRVEVNEDSALFKIKYLIKEFEKSFLSIAEYKGEYSRFEALEKIGELNNSLRMIAKIASNLKLNDVLKLAEVTYVFLKYLKDYRMDLLEPEIQQIIKYIIFTFKMLLTNRRPDDFNVLVQHLNNPVKIFADS
jgi:hypothetical protein